MGSRSGRWRLVLLVRVGKLECEIRGKKYNVVDEAQQGSSKYPSLNKKNEMSF